MERYRFMDDYSEGCHPDILNELNRVNLRQSTGYSEDEISQKAKNLIRAEIRDPNAGVFFVSGGTQANLIVISAMLKPHEAVISANTGHILIHEAGAIEATGHKIISMPSKNGRLTTDLTYKALKSHDHFPHTVKPKLVYISNATETGTVYRKKELEDLSEFCRNNDLKLFMDGARLGTALASSYSDLTMRDIYNLTDAFYIGGTKNGALIGEAIVTKDKILCSELPVIMKQRGALLAKGRLLGIQFHELFKEDLFFKLPEHANKMAAKISSAMRERHYKLISDTESNMIFAELPDSKIRELKENFEFYVWEPAGNKSSIVRIVTSWASDKEYVDKFISQL